MVLALRAPDPACPCSPFPLPLPLVSPPEPLARAASSELSCHKGPEKNETTVAVIESYIYRSCIHVCSFQMLALPQTMRAKCILDSESILSWHSRKIKDPNPSPLSPCKPFVLHCGLAAPCVAFRFWVIHMEVIHMGDSEQEKSGWHATSTWRNLARRVLAFLKKNVFPLSRAVFASGVDLSTVPQIKTA